MIITKCGLSRLMSSLVLIYAIIRWETEGHLTMRESVLNTVQVKDVVEWTFLGNVIDYY